VDDLDTAGVLDPERLEVHAPGRLDRPRGPIDPVQTCRLRNHEQLTAVRAETHPIDPTELPNVEDSANAVGRVVIRAEVAVDAHVELAVPGRPSGTREVTPIWQRLEGLNRELPVGAAAQPVGSREFCARAALARKGVQRVGVRIVGHGLQIARPVLPRCRRPAQLNSVLEVRIADDGLERARGGVHLVGSTRNVFYQPERII